MKKILVLASLLTFLGFVSGGLTAEKPSLIQPVGIVELAQTTNPGKVVQHGSGVFISPTIFVTAAHVVDPLINATNATGHVRLSDGTLYNIVSAKKSDGHDVALVTIDSKSPYTGFIPSVSCDEPVAGDELTTIGNPLNVEFLETKVMATGGKVSATEQPAPLKDKDIPAPKKFKTGPKTGANNLKRVKPGDVSPQEEKKQYGEELTKREELDGMEFFQGVALPGQSGSPLYDKNNNVVGVLSISVVAGPSFTGLGMYVPNKVTCQFLLDALAGK